VALGELRLQGQPPSSPTAGAAACGFVAVLLRPRTGGGGVQLLLTALWFGGKDGGQPLGRVDVAPCVGRPCGRGGGSRGGWGMGGGV
jgi:hypothetical protein